MISFVDWVGASLISFIIPIILFPSQPITIFACVMDIKSILLIIIFVNGLLAIAFEHQLQINKSWIAVFTGTAMWILASIGTDPKLMHLAISEGSAEIFELIVFLIGAMTIVEMLGHFRFFNWIESKLMEKNISNKQLFWMLGLITFFGSAMLDNLTTTLVMIQIGKKLYIRKENFNTFLINTVIAANAGGAMSPVGDVTTIMMWLAGKFTAWQILIEGFLPSLVAWIIPQSWLTSRIVFEDRKSKEIEKVPPLKWYIIIMGLSTFLLAVLVNLIHLPPFFGILFGLGLSAIIIDHRLKKGKLLKKTNKIVNVIRTIDMATIVFFIGILLAVNALGYYGILDQIALFIFGNNPGSNPTALISGHIILGIVSAFMDNVPLTAAVIDMLPDGIHPQYWVLLAITAGTGGSIMVVGSAAGVAAMGQEPKLTFTYYLRNGSLPAFAGYIAAAAVWWLQMKLMGS